MISSQPAYNPEFETPASKYNQLNKTADYRLTIVVPVYNEEDNILRLENKLSEYIGNLVDFSCCILFIDDGSTDRSMDLIKEVCHRNDHFFYLKFYKNRGLSTAIKAGFDAVCSEYVGYIDADLQTTPEDFNLLIPHLDEYEMVMGIRANRNDSFVKKISSKIANGFRRFMTNDGIEDTGCPLKIIRTEYAKRIPMFNGMHRFLPALIQLQNGGVKQVPVRHFPRIAGKAKYNLANRLIAPFLDCFAYRWMKNRHISYQTIENNL